MKKISTKKIFALVLSLVLIVAIVTGCQKDSHASSETESETKTQSESETAKKEDAEVVDSENKKQAKYIFMFIGDGMAAVQVNSAQIANGTNEHNNITLDSLNFQDFEAVGYQTTHDATSFAPDSASTATSLSSGFKTWSGTLGLKPVGNSSENTEEAVDTENVPKTIAERLKEEKDMKIGIISTVTINHATPAAYYAHIPSRNDYYDIALQMAESDFDYFGGGTINKATGDDEDQQSAYEIMEENGYKVVDTKEDILALDNTSDKVYAVTPVTQDSGAMPYAIDIKEGDLKLADFVKKGIDVLDNDNGFFMMAESGKIDWAGHANDAKTNIEEVIDFEEAIQVAIDFAKEHPEETLIIVTGDHETGGMTIGQATTGYDTFFEILDNQKMSYVAFDELFSDMIEENSELTFEDVMPVITENFGLVDEMKDADTPDQDESYMALELNDYEVERLEVAFEESLREEPEGQHAYRDYGGYNPLSVTLTHILNNKAGIGWTSYSHTGVPVPVYSTGAGAELFNGAYDNTEVYEKLVSATGL